MTHHSWLLKPERLWSWAELHPSKVMPPRHAGVYGWYFNHLPAVVPTADCHCIGSLVLAYVGIAPKAIRAELPPSKQTLRNRVRYHFRGNAEGSTLRLTLGCLLAEELGLELRRVGSGKRLTFHAGEAKLSAWLAEHARVVFIQQPEPWMLEKELIGTLPLPLNLAENSHHPFHSTLTGIRAEQKRRARQMPICP